MPRRPNVRPDEAGRARVLAAGAVLFAEQGFEATSIAELGTRADLAKSVLYHYFGSKAGLYAEVLEAATAELVARVAAAVPAGEGEPRLRAGVDAYLGYLVDEPDAARLLLREPPADPQLVALQRRLADQREAALGTLLASARKRRSRSAHLGLVTTAIRTFSLWWLDHPNVPREQVTQAILDVAVAGSKFTPRTPVEASTRP
jgi:AcrR family transcriptional regulator